MSAPHCSQHGSHVVNCKQCKLLKALHESSVGPRDTHHEIPVVSQADAVNHPAHYGGQDNPYEAIKVIEAWGLGFCLGNTVKYISRAGQKDPAKELEDLKKARWYLDQAIKNKETES